ncbi:MAG: M23 family metallopeptidase [Lacisediminihabitans sp.]
MRTTAPASIAPALAARRQSVKRRLLSKLVTLGAMVGVAGLMISTSLPANAFYRLESMGVTAAKQVTADLQTMRIEAITAAAPVTRDAYTVSSLVQQLRLKYGTQNFVYSNNPNGSIQWPFPAAVMITSGFGPRIAPCGGCSSFHEGVDFTPGAGVAIGSVAAGVVSIVKEDRGGLGSHVVVDHVINGQKVQSLYAHMLYGSIRVAVGQTVTVAQQIGQVGSTGASTGAHLHLEIFLDGVPVDPFAWLKANAN